MIIVTGGAGFIGSNIVYELNQGGYNDVLVVDDLTDGSKFTNLVDLTLYDYLDKDDFMARILAKAPFLPKIEAIFHLGACSATTEWNGKFLMENNYQYSKNLLHYCLEQQIPFIYASSAAVYGDRRQDFIEETQFERPLNMYGYSKFLFDNYVRKVLPEAKSQICGLRYFNVYGPREAHKNQMSSVAYHLYEQLQRGENLQLFTGSEHYQRDFIYVADAAKLNLWCWQQRRSGIFNCGTGRAESFQTIADAVIAFYKKGQVQYIPFPEQLKSRYQTFTQADLTKLRRAGYQYPFKTVAEGVHDYLTWLHNHQPIS